MLQPEWDTGISILWQYNQIISLGYHINLQYIV
jgi:hypothetical protein